jgi:hypothetical protein
MKTSGSMAVIMVLMLFSAGCVSQNRNYDITVSNLNPEGFQQDIVGNFDIYTGSFQISNPTNMTFDNVDVEITLAPTAAYCHGVTKTFTIPRFFPLEKRKVLVSIAEFGDLDCQYNFSYQVFL